MQAMKQVQALQPTQAIQAMQAIQQPVSPPPGLPRAMRLVYSEFALCADTSCQEQ